MSDYWTLHVKDFAKIREAKIEAAPLTFFVGDNNSGKSYLLSLMWGLTGGVDFHDRKSSEWSKNDLKLDEVQELLDFWKSRYSGTLTAKTENWHRCKINKEEQSILARGFNTLLASIKDEFIRKIFNDESIYSESINIEIPFYYDNDVIAVKQGDEESKYTWGLDVPYRSSLFNDNGAVDFIERYINNLLGNSVFIPAPRTGFLLTFKTLAQRSIRSMFGRAPKSGDNLTEPQVLYLEHLALLEQDKTEDLDSRIQGILYYIERDIIDGQIIISDTPLPEILYKQNGLDGALPLYLSSGVVAEIAGFISLIKGDRCGRVLIYEEPEMCLHPELQWKMARVLVKFVNAGYTVWASTHSDVIIQHVNNMIKLSNRPDKDQLRMERGYDEDDIISSEKVRMYQFDVDPSDHKTDVKKLECGKNGFRVPTFGKVVREMKDEVWSLRIDKEETMS